MFSWLVSKSAFTGVRVRNLSHMMVLHGPSRLGKGNLRRIMSINSALLRYISLQQRNTPRLRRCRFLQCVISFNCATSNLLRLSFSGHKQQAYSGQRTRCMLAQRLVDYGLQRSKPVIPFLCSTPAVRTALLDRSFFHGPPHDGNFDGLLPRHQTAL